jgi:hypothetical protein
MYTEDGDCVILQKVSEDGVSPRLRNIFEAGSSLDFRNISGDGGSLAIRPQISDVSYNVFWATDNCCRLEGGGVVSAPTPLALHPFSFPKQISVSGDITFSFS